MNIPAYIRRALYGWLAWKGAKSNARYIARQRREVRHG
ncbi:hypothetical protein ABID21_001874 [Pseudorhizobium tarimense]|uniref:Uncharacterized protein n=1 Tax=Pseudorhizobium tarimense TaxID=1079109 RepID=A0ABV2H5D8_9HYPH